MDLQVGIGDTSTVREAQAGGTCEDMREQQHQRPHHLGHEHHHQQQHHHLVQQHHQIATAFHIARPSHPISNIISPPPLHHTSLILDQDPYRIMLQNENFQVNPNGPKPIIVNV